jgi:hypothetical protein
MSNAAHTPGPWESDGQFIVAPDPAGIHPDIYIAEIVATDDEGRMAPPKQQVANASLIAAAPFLFESLLTIAGDKESCTCHTRSWYGNHHDTQCPIRIASDAIADATEG